MRLNKKLSKLQILFMSICFIFSIFFVHNISAEDSSNSSVNSTFEIEFKTATDFEINVELNVNEITVFDTTYTGNEIKNIEDPEVMGAIKLKLRNSIKNQIEDTFLGGKCTAINQKPTYENNEFSDLFSVNLTPDFFDIDNAVNVYDFVNGVLDMGAVISYSFDFQAEAGWNNTYIIILPNSMIFQNTTGEANGNRISWQIKNWNGMVPNKQGLLSIRSTNPTNTESEEDISIDFILDTRGVKNTILDIEVTMRSIDIDKYNILPNFVANLNSIPSDGIRLLIDNNFTSWNDVYQNTVNAIEKKISSKVENSSFDQRLDLMFSWDADTSSNCPSPYDITSMDNVPPIKAKLTDSEVDLRILNISSRALFGLVNAGATANISAEDVNFGDGLDELGYPYNCHIYLPTGIFLDGNNTCFWNQSSYISGIFNSNISPSYSDEKIELYVYIDLTKMDLDLPSFFTGKTKLTIPINTKEDVDMYVMTLPDEFQLPEKVRLDYINSDAFRICTDEHVFSDDEINTFLNDKKRLFEEHLSTVLNGLDIKGNIDEKTFSNSLSWEGDISKMDGITPVIVSLYAHNLYSTNFDISLLPPTFDISNQSFKLIGLNNMSVTYRILFPKGISIEANDTLEKPIIRGKTEDGREYIEIAFDANETNNMDVITCKMSPSLLYVFGLFLPCALSMILAVILIIIIYLLRKKRGKRSSTIRDEAGGPEGYDGQDYYVPPQPPR